MNVFQSVRTCFVKYFQFSGRARRSEFWWFQLFLLGIAIIAAIIEFTLIGPTSEIVTMIVTVVTIAPWAAGISRRLHDIGRSGWYQLPTYIVYIPYFENFFPSNFANLADIILTVGYLYYVALLLVLIKSGNPGRNKYGQNPEEPDVRTVFD